MRTRAGRRLRGYGTIRRWWRRAAPLLPSALATALIATCVETPLPPVGELDVVLALRDDTVNFQTIRTFAMPDTIVHLEEGTSFVSTPISRTFDAQILASVARNFEGRGYVRELAPATNRPDLVVLVAATASTNVTAWASYPWFGAWGFYPGWGFYGGFTPAWGVAYPWAPIGGGIFVWRSGTLLVDAIDARRIDVATQQINSVWGGAMNGVLQGDDSGGQRVLDGIDEMFVLSPYLHR